ncbi:hypothetical protein ABK040_005489 [Willaertia magna]
MVTNSDGKNNSNEDDNISDDTRIPLSERVIFIPNFDVRKRLAQDIAPLAEDDVDVNQLVRIPPIQSHQIKRDTSIHTISKYTLLSNIRMKLANIEERIITTKELFGEPLIDEDENCFIIPNDNNLSVKKDDKMEEVTSEEEEVSRELSEEDDEESDEEFIKVTKPIEVIELPSYSDEDDEMRDEEEETIKKEENIKVKKENEKLTTKSSKESMNEESDDSQEISKKENGDNESEESSSSSSSSDISDVSDIEQAYRNKLRRTSQRLKNKQILQSQLEKEEKEEKNKRRRVRTRSSKKSSSSESSSANEDDNSNESSADDEYKPEKSTRGRKKQNKTTVVNNNNKEKRGRGRPRKVPIEESKKIKYTFKKLEESPEFDDESLSLRDHQIIGVNFLYKNFCENRNSLLSDEMGLGKTIQSLTLLHTLFQNHQITGPFLIVVPLTTLTNWEREAKTWIPYFTIKVLWGRADTRDSVLSDFKKSLKECEEDESPFLGITTYEFFSNRQLMSTHWEIVIFDEAHRLKGLTTKWRKQALSVKCNNFIMLTGTPMQNVTSELWSLLYLLDKKQFPSFKDFETRFGELETDESIVALREAITPYVLRRTKKQTLIDEIPPKEEILVEVELTSIQKTLYRALIEKRASFLKSEMSSDQDLSYLVLSLRKCCNHPYLISGIEDYLKDKETKLNEEELLIQSSSKMILVHKLLKKFRDNNEKVLIMSQFLNTLDIIQEYLLLEDISHVRLDGDVANEERMEQIDKFQNDPECRVFLISTKVGMGINLTAANNVIIYDSDFNPFNDSQAVARCHRIGQTKKVMVYRLITKGTYEKYILTKASKKLGKEKVVLADNLLEEEKDLPKNEFDKMIRYGVYHLFLNDEKEKENDLVNADIDNIIANATKVTAESESDGALIGKLNEITGSQTKEDKKNNNNKEIIKSAYFVPLTETVSDLGLNDEDFWEKAFPDYVDIPTLEHRMYDKHPFTPQELDSYFEKVKSLVNEIFFGVRRKAKLKVNKEDKAEDDKIEDAVKKESSSDMPVVSQSTKAHLHSFLIRLSNEDINPHYYEITYKYQKMVDDWLSLFEARTLRSKKVYSASNIPESKQTSDDELGSDIEEEKIENLLGGIKKQTRKKKKSETATPTTTSTKKNPLNLVSGQQELVTSSTSKEGKWTMHNFMPNNVTPPTTTLSDNNIINNLNTTSNNTTYNFTNHSFHNVNGQPVPLRRRNKSKQSVPSTSITVANNTNTLNNNNNNTTTASTDQKNQLPHYSDLLRQLSNVDTLSDQQQIKEKETKLPTLIPNLIPNLPRLPNNNLEIQAPPPTINQTPLPVPPPLMNLPTVNNIPNQTLGTNSQVNNVDNDLIFIGYGEKPTRGRKKKNVNFIVNPNPTVSSSITTTESKRGRKRKEQPERSITQTINNDNTPKSTTEKKKRKEKEPVRLVPTVSIPPPVMQLPPQTTSSLVSSILGNSSSQIFTSQSAIQVPQYPTLPPQPVTSHNFINMSQGQQTTTGRKGRSVAGTFTFYTPDVMKYELEKKEKKK